MTLVPNSSISGCGARALPHPHPPKPPTHSYISVYSTGCGKQWNAPKYKGAQKWYNHELNKINFIIFILPYNGVLRTLYD